MAGKSGAMQVLDNSLSFPMAELYPSFEGFYNYNTGLKANPDADDQEALNESSDDAQKADSNRPSGWMVLLALGFVCMMAIFMGVS